MPGTATVTVELGNGQRLTGIVVEWCQGGQAVVQVGKHRYRGRRVFDTTPADRQEIAS